MKRDWSVVVLLSLGVMIAYIDRTNLSIALASPDFKRTFALTDAQRGLLNSAFFWSYAALQIPAGFVTDRYGVRWPYAISFLLWSIFTAATAFSTSLWHLFSCRVLLGVGEAIVTPASLRWIATHIGERNRGLAVGILFAGSKFGPAVGADLSVRLMHSIGWQGMFLALGLGALIFLVPWFILVREDPPASPAARATASSEFSLIWKTPAIYGILIGTAAYNYFTYFNLTWLPSYFVERLGMTMSEMGLFTTFSFLGIAAVSIGGGALADQMVRRGGDSVAIRKAFTIAGLAIASTEIFGTLTSSRDAALAFAMISLAGLGLTTANYWALTQTLMPGAAIGRISGLQNFASNIAGIIAPALTGWLIQRTGSYHAPMQAILVVLAMGIAAYVFLVKRQYSPVRGGILPNRA